MSLELIAEQIKAYKDWIGGKPGPDLEGATPTANMFLEGHNHIFRTLESMRIVLQRHEALLLYAHKTLDIEYHRRADELSQKMQDGISAESLKGLTLPKSKQRIDQCLREWREAMKKLKEEFNIE